MKRFVRQLVERLRDPGRPLTRNRHFSTFATPEGRRALTVHRALQSLEEQLLAAQGPEAVQIDRCAQTGRVRLDVGLPALRARRTTFLSGEEFDLLLRSPSVGALLRAAELQRAGT